ncbi:MAG: hypothetical protein AB9891_04475 [Anaerolineaceae bacterium]
MKLFGTLVILTFVLAACAPAATPAPRLLRSTAAPVDPTAAPTEAPAAPCRCRD